MQHPGTVLSDQVPVCYCARGLANKVDDKLRISGLIQGTKRSVSLECK